MERRRAGDRRFGAGGDDQRRDFGGDAAVNFDMDRPVANHAPDTRDFLDHRRNEFLPAEAGIDRHHLHEIEAVEHVIDCVGRRLSPRVCACA